MNEIIKKPEKIETFMYALMKEARRSSFMEFIEEWEITFNEFEDISEWFKEKGITL